LIDPKELRSDVLTVDAAAENHGVLPSDSQAHAAKKRAARNQIGRGWRFPRSALVEALAAMSRKQWKPPREIELVVMEKPLLVSATPYDPER
jgi:hypothetical protein